MAKSALEEFASWKNGIKKYEENEAVIQNSLKEIADNRKAFRSSPNRQNFFRAVGSLVNFSPEIGQLKRAFYTSPEFLKEKMGSKYTEYCNKYRIQSAELPAQLSKKMNIEYQNQAIKNLKYAELKNILGTIKASISINEDRRSELEKFEKTASSNLNDFVIQAMKKEQEMVAQNLQILNEKREVTLKKMVDSKKEIDDEIKDLQSKQEELNSKTIDDKRKKELQADEKNNGSFKDRIDKLLETANQLENNGEEFYKGLKVNPTFNNILEIELYRISRNTLANNEELNIFPTSKNFTAQLGNNYSSKNAMDDFEKLHNQTKILSSIEQKVEKLHTFKGGRRQLEETKLASLIFDNKYPNMKTDDIIADMQKMAQKYPQAGFDQVTKSEIYTNRQQLQSLALYKMLKLKEEAEEYVNQPKVEVVIDRSPNIGIVVETETPDLKTHGNDVVVEAKELDGGKQDNDLKKGNNVAIEAKELDGNLKKGNNVVVEAKELDGSKQDNDLKKGNNVVVEAKELDGNLKKGNNVVVEDVNSKSKGWVKRIEETNLANDLADGFQKQ